MSLKEVTSLDADVVFGLGKLDKKTGKTGPKQVEGYYLGSRTVTGGKYGDNLLHFFQTSKGNVGVWGQGDLNKKLSGITPGTMVKAEFIGMKPTPKGDMRAYKVYQDEDNTIEVAVNETAPSYDESEEELDEDGNVDGNIGEQEYAGEPLAASGQTSADRKAKVDALLAKSRKK